MRSSTIWLLPKKLDRKFTLSEKLSSWFLRPYTVDKNGYIRLKPYTIYRRFGRLGYALIDPYQLHTSTKTPHKFVYERRIYESDGVLFKSDEALALYKKSRRIMLSTMAVMRKIRKSNG